MKLPKHDLRQTRSWYVKLDRLLNEVRDVIEELATSNLPREEKMRALLFFGEFSEGIQTDLLEKYNLTEPFPTCINCGEPIQLPRIEKEAKCKKCNTKMKVIYTANT